MVPCKIRKPEIVKFGSNFFPRELSVACGKKKESQLFKVTSLTLNSWADIILFGLKSQLRFSLPYRPVILRIFFASLSESKPSAARQVQLALDRVPGKFIRASPPSSR